jgi:hypothetical protein
LQDDGFEGDRRDHPALCRFSVQPAGACPCSPLPHLELHDSRTSLIMIWWRICTTSSHPPPHTPHSDSAYAASEGQPTPAPQ